MVMFHTRHMVKQDHRVVRWYPRQMYERYRAVESIAYEMRKKQQLKTRVKIGREDIELSVREAGSTVWRRQSLPWNLPDFDLTESRPIAPSSPPTGRPGRCPGADGLHIESENNVPEPLENIATDIATDSN